MNNLQTKSVCLSLLYGGGNSPISHNFGVSSDNAQKIKSKFAEKFPEINQFVKIIKHKLQTNGYVQSLTGQLLGLGFVGYNGFRS